MGLFGVRKEGKRDAVGPSSWRARRRHGILRSDLDEPAELPAAFAALADHIDRLRQQYESGHLTRAAFAAALDVAKYRAPDGTVWTVGADSGQWYRQFPGSSVWEQALPPEQVPAAGIETNGVAAQLDDGTSDVATPEHARPAIALGAVPAPAVADANGWFTARLETTAPLPTPSEVLAPASGTEVTAPWPSVSARGSRVPVSAPSPAGGYGDDVTDATTAGASDDFAATVWESALWAQPTPGDAADASTTNEVRHLLAGDAEFGDDDSDGDLDLPPELLL